MATNKKVLRVVQGFKDVGGEVYYAKVKFYKYQPKEPIIIQRRFLDSILQFKDMQNNYLEIGIAKDLRYKNLLLCIRRYPAKNKDVWYAIAEYKWV